MTHAREMHTHEVQAHETLACEVHAREVHAHEIHAHEIHARKVHARKVYARKVHAHEMSYVEFSISGFPKKLIWAKLLYTPPYEGAAHRQRFYKKKRTWEQICLRFSFSQVHVHGHLNPRPTRK
jgi:hypothetical protein